jgi:hypothetical protein
MEEGQLANSSVVRSTPTQTLRRHTSSSLSLRRIQEYARVCQVVDVDEFAPQLDASPSRNVRVRRSEAWEHRQHVRARYVEIAGEVRQGLVAIARLSHAEPLRAGGYQWLNRCGERLVDVLACLPSASSPSIDDFPLAMSAGLTIINASPSAPSTLCRRSVEGRR